MSDLFIMIITRNLQIQDIAEIILDAIIQDENL